LTPRVILHLDMDAFYAAIEQRDDPRLAGRPVIIGSPGRRGVVATCSYEARRFGVRSAMPSVTAERLCPDGIWIAPRMTVYRDESRRIFARLEQHVPVTEPVSIDEAYGDLTGAALGFAGAHDLSRRLKDEIAQAHRLTASVGLGPCRFLAKIASDLEKPDGLTVIRRGDVARVLGPLSVRVIPGVGPKLGARLERLGITTIAELRSAPAARLRRELGLRTGTFLARRARGEDDAPVAPHRERQQISEERTYRDDLVGRERIEKELLERADGVAAALRRRGLVARTVVVKVRDTSFRTLTRSRTLDEPTDLAGEIFLTVRELVRKRLALDDARLRLVGVGVKELMKQEEVPRSLFPDERRLRTRRVAAAADSLRARFGSRAARPARLVDSPDRERTDEPR